MSKITLNDISSMNASSSTASTVNNNMAAIETAFENTLSRDGTSPNTMEANLDMNSNRILNLPEPIDDQEPVTKGYVDAALEVITSLSDFDNLADIANISPTDGTFIVGDGANWVGESGATVRTSLGLGSIATHDASEYLTVADATTTYQPLDSDLTAWAAVNPSSYSTTAQIASSYQPLDSDLTSIAALSTTSFGRGLLTSANAAALATSAGVGTGDSPQFTAINLGHASDTTVSRLGAGRVGVEGIELAFQRVFDVKSPAYGAVGNGVANDTTAIQAAITACGAAGGGIVYFPPGTYNINAVLTISSQAVVLQGSSRYASLIQQTTANAGILSFSAIYGGIKSLSFAYSGTPTSGGTAITTTSSQGTFDDFVIRSAYVGFFISGTSATANKITNFDIINYEAIGVQANNMNDAYLHNFIINAGNSTRGALGGIRLTNKVEAFIASNGDILNGVYSMTTDASVNSIGTRPAYNKFTNVYFDSSTNGCSIDKMYETSFTACWFSGGRSGGGNAGCTLNTTGSIKFVSCEFFNCGSNGLSITANATNTFLTGCSIESNSVTAGANTADGLITAANTTTFYIVDCKFSNGLYTGTQRYGLNIATGCNHFSVMGCAFAGNATGGILNNSATPSSRFFIGNTGTTLTTVREQLIANRTYYVDNTNGNDANIGLSAGTGNAFKTIQKAVDVALGLDFGVYSVTIQVADGTYSGAVAIAYPIVGSGTLTIQGNSGTPANVLISTTSANAFVSSNGAVVTIKDMKIQTTTAGYCLAANAQGTLSFSNINFGACAYSHIYSAFTSAVYATGNYAISGGAQCHIECSDNASVFDAGFTITLSGTPAFSVAFCKVNTNATVSAHANTFAGTGATGSRFSVLNGAVLYTAGAATTYLPGNAAGTGTNFSVTPWGLYA